VPPSNLMRYGTMSSTESPTGGNAPKVDDVRFPASLRELYLCVGRMWRIEGYVTDVGQGTVVLHRNILETLFCLHVDCPLSCIAHLIRDRESEEGEY